MANAHTSLQGGPGDPQLVEDDDAPRSRQEDTNGGIDSHGRSWYQFRPEPRRRSDLMGVNSRWWMALGWLILVLLIVFPFPFWSW
jgi:hypothetical protein